MVFLVIPNLIGYRNALASSIRLSHSIVKTSKFLSDALACLAHRRREALNFVLIQSLTKIKAAPSYLKIKSSDWK